MQVNCRREKLYVMRMLSTAHGMALVSVHCGDPGQDMKKKCLQNLLCIKKLGMKYEVPSWGACTTPYMLEKGTTRLRSYSKFCGVVQAKSQPIINLAKKISFPGRRLTGASLFKSGDAQGI